MKLVIGLLAVEQNVCGASGPPVITSQPGNLTVAEGNPATFNVGDTPFGMAIGDLNEDGHPDVVTTNGGSTSLLLGTGGGGATLASGWPKPTGQGGYELSGVVLGDFNDLPGSPPFLAVQGMAPDLYTDAAANVAPPNNYSFTFTPGG